LSEKSQFLMSFSLVFGKNSVFFFILYFCDEEVDYV